MLRLLVTGSHRDPHFRCAASPVGLGDLRRFRSYRTDFRVSGDSSRLWMAFAGLLRHSASHSSPARQPEMRRLFVHLDRSTISWLRIPARRTLYLIVADRELKR